MRRREFISLLGSAAAWPLTARAQPSDQTRRIGVLLNLAEDDPETRARLAAFLEALQGLGWSQGRNLQIDYRWGVGDPSRHRANIAELVALAPDVILVHGSTIMGPLQRATRTVPIVFVSVADPIAGGFVDSLAKPGRNATGFTSSDYGMAGKWLELLKQIAPQITRVAVIRDPLQVSGGGQLGAISAVAPLLGVELNPLGLGDAAEIKRTITAFARQPNGGLLVTTAAEAQIHRELIISIAEKNKLPAIYPYRLFVRSGGLMAYGPDVSDEYRRAASYVDRIFKNEKPSDLPVQAPTKYELVINMKAAQAIGLTVPPSLLIRASEVVE
jgi:putative tryptophan/tyrosine transport system substrate-binding protein